MSSDARAWDDCERCHAPHAQFFIPRRDDLEVRDTSRMHRVCWPCCAEVNEQRRGEGLVP